MCCGRLEAKAPKDKLENLDEIPASSKSISILFYAGDNLAEDLEKTVVTSAKYKQQSNGLLTVFNVDAESMLQLYDANGRSVFLDRERFAEFKLTGEIPVIGEPADDSPPLAENPPASIETAVEPANDAEAEQTAVDGQISPASIETAVEPANDAEAEQTAVGTLPANVKTLKKADLVKLADSLGISSKGTKAEILGRLL